jgi:hypothetical protein
MCNVYIMIVVYLQRNVSMFGRDRDPLHSRIWATFAYFVPDYELANNSVGPTSAAHGSTGILINVPQSRACSI